MTSMNRSALINVAKLYYYGNLSQEQIAKTIGVSRPKVSRMLAMARELNIVEIRVSDSSVLNEQMQRKLQERLRLESVTVVPSGATLQHTLQNAGAAACARLNAILRDGMYIGVSWGTTMDSIVHQFTPERAVSGVTVVQMLGGIRTQSFNIDSREVALTLAERLGSNYSLLQAPYLVSSGQVRDVLLNEPEFAAHFRLFEKLDAAIVGIGSCLPERSVPYMAGYITLEQSRALVEQGFAADICGSRIFKDGSARPNTLTDRIIGISLDRLRDVPNVMAVAVGEDKAQSIEAAARGGFIKSLVTDEVAAISMLGAENLE